MKRQLIVLVAGLTLAPAVITPRSLASPAQHGAAVPPAQDTHMMEMREMRQKMMETMRASNPELKRLVAAMNAAQGDAKIPAMADLLTRMVQQQTTMREEMQASMQAMAAACPMMKGAGTHDHKP